MNELPTFTGGSARVNAVRAPYETYTAYLESQHWHDLREAAFNRANRRCEVCACKARDGHHLIYRTPLESCTVEDIMALCDRCHKVWHDWLKQVGKKVHQFCRQSTRGGILVLLNPSKEVATVVKRVPYVAPSPKPKPARTGKIKISKREKREIAIDSALWNNDETKHALSTMEREDFKKFMRLRFSHKKAWNSIASTAINLYDRNKKLKRSATESAS